MRGISLLVEEKLASQEAFCSTNVVCLFVCLFACLFFVYFFVRLFVCLAGWLVG
jgi:hypothetical protein